MLFLLSINVQKKKRKKKEKKKKKKKKIFFHPPQLDEQTRWHTKNKSVVQFH